MKTRRAEERIGRMREREPDLSEETRTERMKDGSKLGKESPQNNRGTMKEGENKEWKEIARTKVMNTKLVGRRKERMNL